MYSKNLITLVVRWTVVLNVLFGLGSAVVSVGSCHVDPTDDFNFSVYTTEARISERATRLSVHRVEEVLAARIDLVPLPKIPALARHIVHLCRYYRFDPAFILSIIQVESSFHVKAISPVGAIGLMQLMPATANVVVRDMELPLEAHYKRALRAGRHVERHVRVVNRRLLMNPIINVTLGVAYLARLRKHYHGMSQDFLLAAYNMGPARVDELISKKHVKQVRHLKYLEAVRQRLSEFRNRRKSDRPAQSNDRV